MRSTPWSTGSSCCCGALAPSFRARRCAIWFQCSLLGHHPTLREELIEQWIGTMRLLIPINEAALFAHYGKPEGWEKQ